ncbi:hypothetical protein SNR37_002301 [Agarivorans aestuarii]|uniref:Flagellar protein FliT n=1 Tax=Agarivorans aestuarii TaxID=1563703 RepID=A0ABU7G0V4_9ALTE|nr:hypothetical protein [Agarivorans aestuarii]MEE1672890.1 hypothetical protein [Agarivorans aestuarii]
MSQVVKQKIEQAKLVLDALNVATYAGNHNDVAALVAEHEGLIKALFQDKPLKPSDKQLIHDYLEDMSETMEIVESAKQAITTEMGSLKRGKMVVGKYTQNL